MRYFQPQRQIPATRGWPISEADRQDFSELVNLTAISRKGPLCNTIFTSDRFSRSYRGGEAYAAKCDAGSCKRRPD